MIRIQNKAKSTINNARRKLNQLSRTCNLDDPKDVEKAISYAKLGNASKNAFALMYFWYTQANGIQWKKIKYKVQENAPLIPSSSQVNRIVSASTVKYATIFKVMARTAVEPEELHQIHRNQFDPTTNAMKIRGLKGHGAQNYPLPENIATMLKAYLAKYPDEYPFPSAKSISEMWRRARTKASQNHSDPTLLTIPVKTLRNYSGAQFYLNSDIRDPINTMRHFRHKRMETTMHYLRNMVIDTDPQYDVEEADTIEKCKDLARKGFVKFDEINDKHLYRRRKQFE